MTNFTKPYWQRAEISIAPWLRSVEPEAGKKVEFVAPDEASILTDRREFTQAAPKPDTPESLRAQSPYAVAKKLGLI